MIGDPAPQELAGTAAHRVKQRVYPEMLRQYAKPLEGSRLITMLRHTVIITHASYRSAVDALAFLNLKLEILMIATRNKTEVINRMKPLCYIDDHSEQLTKVRVPVIPYVDNIYQLFERIVQCIPTP